MRARQLGLLLAELRERIEYPILLRDEAVGAVGARRVRPRGAGWRILLTDEELIDELSADELEQLWVTFQQMEWSVWKALDIALAASVRRPR